MNELTDEALFKIASIKERILYYTYIFNESSDYSIDYFTDNKYSPIDISGVSSNTNELYALEIKLRLFTSGEYKTAFLEVQKFLSIYKIYLERPDLNYYYTVFFKDRYSKIDLHPLFQLHKHNQFLNKAYYKLMNSTTAIDGEKEEKLIFEINLSDSCVCWFNYPMNAKYTNDILDLDYNKLNIKATKKYYYDENKRR